MNIAKGAFSAAPVSAPEVATGPFEKVLYLLGKAKSIEEQMGKNLKQTHHKYVELLLEQKIHFTWIEMGERLKEELRKVIYADQRIQTYLNAVKSTTRVKEAISRKVEEIEQLKKNLKENKPVSEDDIPLAEAEILSIESNINTTPVEELQELEKVIEKSAVATKEEFWDYFKGCVAGNFSLTSGIVETAGCATETPAGAFEEEAKDFKCSPIKSGVFSVIPEAKPVKPESAAAGIERVDTTLKVKNNKLFDRIRTELHSDYGQYVNSLEFDNCCIDCEEAIKIGQLLTEKEAFSFRFVNTQGSLHVLLGSIGPKVGIPELSVVGAGLQPVINYLQQPQKVRSITVENVGILDAVLINALIETVAKNTAGRSLTLKGVDFGQIPVMLLEKVGFLRELHLVKCNWGDFAKLIDILVEGKSLETLEMRDCLKKEYVYYELLAKLLRRNHKISTLNISENEITPENLRVLAKSTPEIKSVETIIMDHCTYDSKCQTELEEVLFEIIKGGQSIQTMSLKGFMLNDDAKAMALLDKWEQQAPNIRSRVELF